LDEKGAVTVIELALRDVARQDAIDLSPRLLSAGWPPAPAIPTVSVAGRWPAAVAVDGDGRNRRSTRVASDSSQTLNSHAGFEFHRRSGI